jgi:hypothetical protein
MEFSTETFGEIANVRLSSARQAATGRKATVTAQLAHNRTFGADWT